MIFLVRGQQNQEEIWWKQGKVLTLQAITLQGS